MSKKTKILLVSLSAGAGHIRAAQAIQKTGALQYPRLSIEHIDMADYISLSMKKTAIDSYALIVKRMPELWGFLYEKIDSGKTSQRFNRLTKQLKQANSLRLYNYVREYRPDAIICTHFLPADVLLNAPKRFKPNVPINTVITDFDLHNLWIVPDTARYFVATEKMKWKMANKGVRESQITISGIPIDPVFFQDKNIKRLKKKHNIPENKKVALVLSGGVGLTRTDRVIRALGNVNRPLHVVAIAGKNKKLYTKLTKLSLPENLTLTAIGWTDEIDEYMRLADIVITKTGGVTTAECIALNKYIIATEPIPGQEERNAEYIMQNDYGVVAHTPNDLTYHVTSFLDEPKKYNKKTPNGALTVLKKVLAMV